MDSVRAFMGLSSQMSNNSVPGRSHCEGALGSALGWPWGIVDRCWALGSEALEVEVSGNTLED